MYDRNWISAHIFYHRDQDVLFDHGIRPLLERLVSDDLCDSHFFVRHWQGGPHVRLRVLPKADVGQDMVAGLMESYLYGFLNSYPCSGEFGETAYTQMAGPLVRMEREQSSLAPLEPNNSLRYVAYEPEYGRYGCTVESMAVVHQHFRESSDLALDILRSGMGRDQRAGQALAMMLMSALTCDNSPQGLLQFCGAGRNDWGRWLVPGDVGHHEAAFEKRFQRQRERLYEQVARVTDTVRRVDPQDVDGCTGRWLRSISTLKHKLVALDRRGLFQPQDMPLSNDCNADEHRGLCSVLLFCTHMNNNRMGMSLPDEAYLMYLLWRTVSERVESLPT